MGAPSCCAHSSLVAHALRSTQNRVKPYIQTDGHCYVSNRSADRPVRDKGLPDEFNSRLLATLIND
jgi:hypothetical protein